MFHVDTETKKITLHRGDTGIVPFKLTGYTFDPDDRALVTIKSSSGTVILKQLYEIDSEGMIRVEFTNGLTDRLNAEILNYDVRVAIKPIYDQSDPPELIDVDFEAGGAVCTPESPLQIEILGTVGQI